MTSKIITGAIAGALAFSGALAAGQTALADEAEARHYEITIRNALLGQPVAPSLFVTHDSSFSLFEIGDSPSDGLAIMAETGNPGPLAGEVSGEAGVYETVVLPTAHMPPVLFPGESNSTVISALGDAKHFSAVGMLAATNDAFYALRNVALPKRGSITVRAAAYDAGSEANTELAADIPASGNDNFDEPMGGEEDHIHVHAGIHGVGDFDPATFDWRNPVVEITITRLTDD